jgi:formylglycine-generating enzyme required for sulfatase activity
MPCFLARDGGILPDWTKGLNVEFVLIALVLQALVFGFFCGYIAQEKGRRYGSWFALGFFFSILAVFALIAVPKIESPARDVGDGDAWPPAAPERPASIPAPAPQQLFDGQQDIALPAYQLFLTNRFGIEKNNTLDKFVIGNDVFNDLHAALADADARYGQQLAELAAQKLQLEREASAREQSRIEAAKRDQTQAEQRRAREELHRVESAALAKQQEEARQKAIRKVMPWAIGVAVVVCVVGGMLFRQHSIQEEAARVARQAAEEAVRLAWQPTGKVIKDCADCPEMLAMPAGSFEMGSGADDPSATELPLHQVKLPGFLLGRTEVTQGQWRAVMGNNPSRFKDCGDDCPVENISWDDAQLFATKLSQKTGKTYRLPTEAEWEYAARASGKGQWGFGDDESQLGAHAWFSANSDGKTHPVGQKKASVIGLHDMHGNVWEWVQDVWHENYQGAPSDGSAWVNGGDQARRVLRGGAWYYGPRILRSAVRLDDAPGYRNGDTGMRIARNL